MYMKTCLSYGIFNVVTDIGKTSSHKNVEVDSRASSFSDKYTLHVVRRVIKI